MSSHRLLQPYTAELKKSADSYFTKLLQNVKYNRRACESFNDKLLFDLNQCGTAKTGLLKANPFKFFI